MTIIGIVLDKGWRLGATRQKINPDFFSLLTSQKAYGNPFYKKYVFISYVLENESKYVEKKKSFFICTKTIVYCLGGKVSLLLLNRVNFNENKLSEEIC